MSLSNQLGGGPGQPFGRRLGGIGDKGEHRVVHVVSQTLKDLGCEAFSEFKTFAMDVWIVASAEVDPFKGAARGRLLWGVGLAANGPAAFDLQDFPGVSSTISSIGALKTVASAARSLAAARMIRVPTQSLAECPAISTQERIPVSEKATEQPSAIPHGGPFLHSNQVNLLRFQPPTLGPKIWREPAACSISRCSTSRKY